MAIALKLGGDGNLQQLQVSDTLQVDAIDLLSATGTLSIGAGMGVSDDIQLGAAASLVTVLGDGEVDGDLTLSGSLDFTDSSTQVWRDGNDLKFKDTNTTTKTLSELAASSSGISESEHEALDTIAHEIVETHYEEFTYVSGRLTNATTWETSGKTKKVREKQITYSSGQVSTYVVIQYDSAGTESYRMTYTYSYSSGKVSSISAVRS